MLCCKDTLIVPFDIAAYRTGDRIKRNDFLVAISTELQKNADRCEVLEETLEERNREILRLREHIATMEENLTEYYHANDPYYQNGVFPEDFQ